MLYSILSSSCSNLINNEQCYVTNVCFFVPKNFHCLPANALLLPTACKWGLRERFVLTPNPNICYLVRKPLNLNQETNLFNLIFL